MGNLVLKSRHRLKCGDSTNADDVAALMDGAKADLCFTSPPYGQQRDYTAEGKEKCADWDGLMRGVFANLPMADAGQVIVNLGLIHRDGEWLPYWDGWIQWMRERGWRRFGWYVWDQGSGLPGDWNGRLAPSHEFCFHFNRVSVNPSKFVDKRPGSIREKNPTAGGLRSKDGVVQKITNPEAYGQPTKIPDSVLRINRSSETIRSLHPAVFPVALSIHILQSWPGLAYEPFSGSGTTIIAAEQLGRSCYAMEISPQYCDVAVQRFEKMTGEKAVLHG